MEADSSGMVERKNKTQRKPMTLGKQIEKLSQTRVCLSGIQTQVMKALQLGAKNHLVTMAPKSLET